MSRLPYFKTTSANASYASSGGDLQWLRACRDARRFVLLVFHRILVVLWADGFLTLILFYLIHQLDDDDIVADDLLPKVIWTNVPDRYLVCFDNAMPCSHPLISTFVVLIQVVSNEAKSIDSESPDRINTHDSLSNNNEVKGQFFAI